MRIAATLLLLALACTAQACQPDCMGSPWHRKDAHRCCAPRLHAYPNRVAPPCAALHMCANEAVLSGPERTKLETMMTAAKCAPP